MNETNGSQYWIVVNPYLHKLYPTKEKAEKAKGESKKLIVTLIALKEQTND